MGRAVYQVDEQHMLQTLLSMWEGGLLQQHCMQHGLLWVTWLLYGTTQAAPPDHVATAPDLSQYQPRPIKQPNHQSLNVTTTSSH
jgi:hypothetical protein